MEKGRKKQRDIPQQNKSPEVAPGMTEEPIEEEATPKEIAQGEFTRVVKLDMDRNVP